MPTPSARRARVQPLYELLAGINTLEEFLAELVRLAPDEIHPDLSCGLTAQVEGRKLTIASSDDLAASLDQLQYDAGEGPCLTAIATATPVEINDLADTDQWPTWRDEATKRGLRQARSTPLTTSTGDVLGALNLYATSPGRFTETDRDAANVFAAQAAGALAVVIRLAQMAELTGHLEAALQSRAVIDQAKGILMAEQHCTVDEAFTLLRHASMNRNIKIRDLATEIVTRVSPRRERQRQN